MMLTDWPAWRFLRASLPVFPRLSCTFTAEAVDASFASREIKDALRSEINSYAAMPAP
jgi:hypothetical protein